MVSVRMDLTVVTAECWQSADGSTLEKTDTGCRQATPARPPDISPSSDWKIPTLALIGRPVRTLTRAHPSRPPIGQPRVGGLTAFSLQIEIEI